MSCDRFFVTPQNICEHTACSSRALAFVCLYTATTTPTRSASGPPASARLQKSAYFRSASPLPSKTHSAFLRALSVLSP